MADITTPVKIAVAVDRLSDEAVTPLLATVGRWPAEYQRIVIRTAINKLERHLARLKPDAHPR